MRRLNMPVEEFTTPSPICAQTHANVRELRSLMDEHGIRHILINEGERVVGVVSERDLRLVEGLDLNEKTVITASDLMSKDPVSVDAENSLDDVALLMSERKIGSVIVYEGDDLLGIFTLTDALNALVEIVRECSTE